MKKNILLLVTLLLTLVSFGQEISGKWYGDIKTPTGELPIEINITKTENGFSTTMDSPTQKAFGIPITTTNFQNSVLTFAIPAGKISYEGTFNKDNKIVGLFTQRGQNFPLSFDRQKTEKAALIRPQEPKKPYPYYSEDVTFENKKDGVSLAGTLTLPSKEGNFPVVVLITGSSPQNRDEEILDHKPFLVIADYLTRNGIGVLRYDDRGTAASKGNYATATTLDFSYDAEAAVTYLLSRKEVNKNKIGLMGHSEGGVIAPIVASRNKNVSFIVLLAGTGLRGDKLLLLQQELIAKDAGTKEEDIKKNKELNIKLFNVIL
ncbi:MAG: alpha/beta hydrolase, partial [Flavobacteriaceae bacterium]|nr:alpha/beta hydrolase [Flavobacteriaceae bacterium]